MSLPHSRQVALDLETTGLAAGNRIIEVGCVELIDRSLTGRVLQQYVNPERDIEEGALRVHGITRAQLVDKPKFVEVLDELLAFVEGAEVLIHNAPFDLSFLDYELEKAGRGGPFAQYCATVTDTLELAKELSSGGSTLDQLCDFYKVDRSDREKHGALLDARLLAQVYLRMTGGQIGLTLSAPRRRARRAGDAVAIRVLPASPEDLRAHEEFLDLIQDRCAEGRSCIWRNTD